MLRFKSEGGFRCALLTLSSYMMCVVLSKEAGAVYEQPSSTKSVTYIIDNSIVRAFLNTDLYINSSDRFKI